ncbi:MAG TPA: hypothetical protein VE870_03245 [Bacteroidales bacterium]|nr:hypothetical protein [Bacteroidales bacterium]
MIREFHFRIDELTIDHKEIATLLGYPNGESPASFNHHFQEALCYAHNLEDIGATNRVIDNVIPDTKEKKVWTENIHFEVGKMICHELNGSEKTGIFYLHNRSIYKQEIRGMPPWGKSRFRLGLRWPGQF